MSAENDLCEGEQARRLIPTALASLSNNPIIKYYDAISDLDLQTLELRSREAFEAVKRADSRRVLIAMGLFKISDRKTGKLEIELDETFSRFMADPRSEHRGLKSKFERLRQMLTDMSTFRFDASSSETNLILGKEAAGKLFHALDLLVFGIYNNPYRAAWHDVPDNYISMSSKTEAAWKSIYYILEDNLKPNRGFLHKYVEIANL